MDTCIDGRPPPPPPPPTAAENLSSRGSSREGFASSKLGPWWLRLSPQTNPPLSGRRSSVLTATGRYRKSGVYQDGAEEVPLPGWRPFSRSLSTAEIEQGHLGARNLKNKKRENRIQIANLFNATLHYQHSYSTIQRHVQVCPPTCTGSAGGGAGAYAGSR